MKHILRWVFINPWFIPLTLLVTIFAWCIGDEDGVECYIDFIFDQLILGRSWK